MREGDLEVHQGSVDSEGLADHAGWLRVVVLAREVALLELPEPLGDVRQNKER